MLHTLEVIDRLQGVLSTLKDAETGQRGFLLTGDEGYLEPYNEAQESLQREIAALQALTVDNPAHQERVALIGSLSRDKMAEIEETVVLKRAEKSTGALEMVRTDRGKVLMDRLRSLIEEMSAEEHQILTRRTAKRARRRWPLSTSRSVDRGCCCS